MQQQQSAPPPAGEAAPAFSLPSTASQTITLDQYRGKVGVAIVFLGNHPTPAPVIDVLQSSLVEFGRRRVQLLVVAVGTIANAHSLQQGDGIVPVLADGDGAVTASYGAVGEGGDLDVFWIDSAGRMVEHLAMKDRDVVDGLLKAIDSHGRDAEPNPVVNAKSNSPIVMSADGQREVNVEEWDPMPESLRAADDLHEADLPGDAMDGPAPTG